MDTNTLIPIMFAGAILLIGFAFASTDNKKGDARIKELSKTKEMQIKRKNDPDAERRRKMIGNLKDLEMKEKQLRKARVSLSSQLEQAGLNITELTFWMWSIGAGLIAASIVMILQRPIYIAAGAALGAGLGLPRWVLGFLVKRRQNKFIAEFPNSIEVIVRGVKSGLPLMECLKMIGREAAEPLAGEFRRVVDQCAMGVSVESAMAKMFERNPLPEVSFFTIVLSIQAKAGGNLSEALGNLANVLRSRKLMREKVKAMASEANASASIIGALPIVVATLVSFTAPDYMRPIFVDKTGQMFLMIGGCMMGMGIFVMRKMISFDI